MTITEMRHIFEKLFLLSNFWTLKDYAESSGNRLYLGKCYTIEGVDGNRRQCREHSHSNIQICENRKDFTHKRHRYCQCSPHCMCTTKGIDPHYILRPCRLRCIWNKFFRNGSECPIGYLVGKRVPVPSMYFTQRTESARFIYHTENFFVDSLVHPNCMAEPSW